jgi:hypothetical protein
MKIIVKANLGALKVVRSCGPPAPSAYLQDYGDFSVPPYSNWNSVSAVVLKASRGWR